MEAEITPKSKETSHQILFGDIFHKRFIPKINSFKYKSYYLLIDISRINRLKNKILSINSFNILGFYHKDHPIKTSLTKSNKSIPDSGADYMKWIRDILEHYNVNIKNPKVLLLTMPRVLGYVFNPVSFWFCLDEKERLIAVIAEVNNTFGESHNYICYKNNKTEIIDEDIIEAEKIFHVSPFMQRQGKYKFRFKISDQEIGVSIDYYDDYDQKLLATSVTGKLAKYNELNLLKAFFTCPFLTLKTISMIHWQALKLFLKGLKYVPKPKQLSRRFSSINKKIK